MMNFRDLKIGTQLRLGLGVILALVMVLGVVTWMQTEDLWLQTKGLYEHPFTVRQAVDAIEAQVLAMHRDIKDLCLVETDQERKNIDLDLDRREVEVHRQFKIVHDSYLGPQTDILEAEKVFIEWKAIRDETHNILREGKIAEAIKRTRPADIGGRHVEKILSEIKDISDFAKKRADRFYFEAKEHESSLRMHLIIVIGVILSLCLIVTWILIKGIKEPITELTAVTGQFRQGKMDIRSRYSSSNEFGGLSGSFNAMADAIQTHMQINEKAAQLAGVMLREEEAHVFCHELLKALLAQTGSQVGAVYFLNDAKTAFEHFESIGLGAGARAAFSASELEGELGTALAARQIHRIGNIPADTRFAFAAVSGNFMPREILTIPVLSDRYVAAMISLASIRAYDAESIRLVNDVWSVLTARVNGILAFRKIKDLAVRLESQNRELDAQKQELAAQAGELTEQNTELEMQKRQLDEANRLKSSFLSNMSHELRTPLNSVIALSSVLHRRLRPAGPVPSPGMEKDENAGSGDPASLGVGQMVMSETHVTIPAEEYGYLEIIERNGRSLLALINDILDLSRIEAGREEISITRFSLRELASELAAMFEPLVLEKKIAFLNEVPGDLPLMESDRDKCCHILQNLASNAVKFTEQGQVVITAQQSGGEIHIIVSDTGIGIAAGHLSFIFDEFRQADDSTSRKYGGTGLGLAIAKKYALMLGGGIGVESTLGKGSTFTLRLPLVLKMPGATRPEDIGQSSTEYASRAMAISAMSGRGQTVLVVEDNEPAIVQLTDILQTDGYRVQVARNGQEALAWIEQKVPDAMILDLMMPEVDGFQVLRAVRSAERTSSLPVLILTAKHVTKEELSFLKGNNIHQLIQKGDINKAGLLAAVARMASPHPHAASVPNTPAPRFTRSGKPVVLVVEDNADSRRTAKALLQDRYHVLEAADGLAAIEQALACKPDLILMDISMPVLDGVEALKKLRKDEVLRRIPVIAVTASAMKGDRETILAHGFDGYLSKPLDLELLNKTLQEALD